MSGNGRALVQLTEEMWERQLDRTDALEEGQGRTLAEASRAARLSQLVYDRLGPMEKSLAELASWKDDAKVQQVVELKRKLGALEEQRQKEATEKRRNWLDLRRTIAGAVATAVVLETLHRIGVLH